MAERVLITGGAGFIGSHLADELLREGYSVRVLDNLSPQVHGDDAGVPDYLSNEVEFRHGDVRDPEAVRAALQDVDAVYHLAAAVGVGQSMYEVEAYTDINNRGTAVLLEELIESPVDRLVVASSMSLYGEGLYEDAVGVQREDVSRTASQLREGRWEPRDGEGGELTPLPTPETKKPALASVYALSKYDQERLCLMIGEAYDIDAVALRFFNVYGPRQALSNPYTGVLAIFGSRYRNEKPPLIFEDGAQKRDFVSVYDIARACRLAMEVDEAAGHVFNIGSGNAYTVREVADRVGRAMGVSGIEPQVTGEYRVGDIRHCFADIRRAQEVLGYTPRVAFDDGLEELAEWIAGQEAVDRVDQMKSELSERGLTLGR